MENVSSTNDLAVELMLLLRQLIRARSIRDPIAELYPQLTAPQVHVLLALGMDGDEANGPAMSSTALAQRTNTSLPTMTGIVDRMERDGFVVRERDPHDRRVVIVRLTVEGERVHQVMRDDVARKLVEFLEALAPAERGSFVATMSRAVHVLTTPQTMNLKPVPEPGSSS
jgi:DNA-binding MarR family transcriptional regulator